MKLTTRKVFVIILFLAIFLLTFRPVTDPDFWWHLRTGELILQTPQIPSQDPFSYTINGKPWITHEWAAEVLIYLAYRAGSFPLLMILFSLIITTAYILVYLRIPHEAKPYLGGLILLLGAAGSNPLWGVRPQMITLFFFSLYLFFLDRYAANHRLRDLVPLPLLMIAWVNFHGGYILGVGVIGLTLAGNLIDLLWRKLRLKQPVQELWKQWLTLALFFCLTTVAALLNPNGYKILIYPFQTLTDPSMQQYIQEWQSPDFSQTMWIPFAMILLLFVYTGLRGGRFSSTAQVLMLLFFCYAGLRDIRNIPLFALVASPPLADQLNSLISIKVETSPPTRLGSWINLLLVVLAVVAVAARFVQQSGKQSDEVNRTYPAQAVDWILANKPGGNLFNPYNWGGYLIWRLYPEYRVYIDGRADVYGSSFLSDYIELTVMKPGWEEQFQQQEIQTVLAEPNSVMANLLRQLPVWQVVFENENSVIFRLTP